MLNYILPPIIIVISLSALIMFLFRKLRQLPAQESIEQQQRKRTASFTSAAGQFGLKILEHSMHKSKLFSLKLHNVSNDLFHSIRERRRKQDGLPPEGMPERRRSVSNATSQAVEPVRPLIRETVVRPQRPVPSGTGQRGKSKEKNQLEEALIRRIAVNPKDIEAYERLGDYYLESENHTDAHECFKQVLRLSPTHHKARLRLRRIERLLSRA